MSWEVGGWLAGLLNTAANDIISKLNTVNNKVTTGGVPIVRKIQRGAASVPNNERTTSVTLSGFTNLDKMVAIINGGASYNGASYNSSYAVVRFASLRSLEKDKLTVYASNNTDGLDGASVTFSYQVIEFW